jgi:hypothetical protein
MGAKCLNRSDAEDAEENREDLVACLGDLSASAVMLRPGNDTRPYHPVPIPVPRNNVSLRMVLYNYGAYSEQEKHQMDNVLSFLASQNGRIVRAVAGIVLIVLGLLVVEGTAGWVLVVIGLVPLAAGVFDFCLAAPLFGKPLRGDALRVALSSKRPAAK